MKIILDGNEIHNRDELYDCIAQQIMLPEWFGRNLDALHDVLTDQPEPVEAVFYDPCQLSESIGERYIQALFTMLIESGACIYMTKE